MTRSGPSSDPSPPSYHRSGGKAPQTEAGFTLIELVAVLLIVAILLAIAIPIFLETSGSANDRAAQSNLSNAILEMKNMYQAKQSYATIWLAAATLTTTAPEYAWAQKKSCTEASPGACVSEYPVDVVSPDGGRGVILAALSKTGVCWYAVDLEAVPTTTEIHRHWWNHSVSCRHIQQQVSQQPRVRFGSPDAGRCLLCETGDDFL